MWVYQQPANTEPKPLAALPAPAKRAGERVPFQKGETASPARASKPVRTARGQEIPRACAALAAAYLFGTLLSGVVLSLCRPGEQAFLFSIARVKDKKQPQVLAAASRQYDERRTAKSYSFTAKSPAQTSNVMRILLPAKPKSVRLDGTKTDSWKWNRADHNTLLLKFENNPDGVKVDIEW